MNHRRRACLVAAVLAAALALGHSAAAAADPANTALVDEAFVRQCSGDSAAAQAIVDQLPGSQARTVAAVMRNAEQALSFPVTDQVPAGIAEDSVIVILGFGLLPDGAMRPTLLQRLDKGLQIATAYPQMPIVTTGGNPHGGRTEADAMAGWLESNGVPPARIHTETASSSTVGNALNTTALMRRGALGSGAVLVTSSDHLRRGVADFLTAGLPLWAVIASDGADHNGPLDPAEVAAVYADARATAGI